MQNLPRIRNPYDAWSDYRESEYYSRYQGIVSALFALPFVAYAVWATRYWLAAIVTLVPTTMYFSMVWGAGYDAGRKDGYREGAVDAKRVIERDAVLGR